MASTTRIPTPPLLELPTPPDTDPFLVGVPPIADEENRTYDDPDAPPPPSYATVARTEFTQFIHYRLPLQAILLGIPIVLVGFLTGIALGLYLVASATQPPIRSIPTHIPYPANCRIQSPASTFSMTLDTNNSTIIDGVTNLLSDPGLLATIQFTSLRYQVPQEDRVEAIKLERGSNLPTEEFAVYKVSFPRCLPKTRQFLENWIALLA